MTQLNGKGTVVELADGPHVFIFSINVLSDLEEDFGSLDLLTESLDRKPFSTARQIVHRMIGTEAPRKAGDLMQGVDLKVLVDGITKALASAIGMSDGELAEKVAEMGIDPQQPAPDQDQPQPVDTPSQV